MFPIGDDQVQGGSRLFFCLYIHRNQYCCFFVPGILISRSTQCFFVNHYGTIPSEINHGQDLYTIFTSMFFAWRLDAFDRKYVIYVGLCR